MSSVAGSWEGWAGSESACCLLFLPVSFANGSKCCLFYSNAKAPPPYNSL